MKALRQTPSFLFLQVLLIVSMVEVGVMFLLPILLPQRTAGLLQAFTDACLLSVFSAPLLWWTIIGPLRRMALMEQAKAEALRSATTGGVITFNEQGTIESFSAAAEQIFGRAAGEVVGEDLGTLIPRQFLTRAHDTAVDRSATPRWLQGTVKITGYLRDGSAVPLAVTIQEARVDSQLLYTAVVRNLVDRERDEMRAEQMVAVAQLGTAFAHRLRNPLTSIKMLVQAGRRQQGPLTFDREDLRCMEDGVRQMERSLQMFLDFARPRKLQRQPVSLRGVLEAALAEIQPRAAQKRVSVRVTPSADDGEIAADRQQLCEALEHLLQNAIDASPAEGLVDVAIEMQETEQITVRVADSGPGIAPDVLAHLFQPFLTTKPTGVGLGLVIARRIIEDHGGRLSVASGLARGACLVVRLPLEGTPPPEACATERLL